MEVLAAGNFGGSTAVYRLRAEASLGKLMFAWCLQHRVAPEQVRFTAAGVELGPDSSLASFGLEAQDVPVVLQALPRQQRTSAPSPARTSAARPNRYEPYVPIPPVVEATVLDSDSDDLASMGLGMAMPVDSSAGLSDSEEDDDLPQVSVEPGIGSSQGPAPGYLLDADAPPLTVEGGGLGDRSLGLSEEEASTDISGNESEDGFTSASDVEPVASRSGPAAAAAVDAGAGGTGAAVDSASESEGEGERRVRFRVVAPTEAGDNALVITTPTDMPLEKLMDTWCQHHGLPRDAARFLVQGQELSAEETPVALGIRSLIPEHLVGVTPLDLDAGRPVGSEAREVRVLVLPRRRLGAPPVK